MNKKCALINVRYRFDSTARNKFKIKIMHKRIRTKNSYIRKEVIIKDSIIKRLNSWNNLDQSDISRAS